MRTFRDIPIKQKMVIIVMATTATALLLAGLGFVAFDSYFFRLTMERDLSSLAQMIADNTTAALAFNDPRAATETLAALRARPHLAAACIYLPDETLFATYLRQDGQGGCPAADRDGVERSSGALTVRRAIVLSGRRIGALVLYYDLGEIAERMRIYGATVLGVLLVSSLIAFLLSSKLRAVIATPIAHLVRATTSVSETGDYSTRAEKLTGDELGVLVDRFNEMLAGIEWREANLRTALREQKEKEEELRRANDDLQQFAYSASHDLQEPIRNVAIYSEIVAEKYGDLLDAEGRQFLGFLTEGGRRLSMLISDLLTYTRAGVVEGDKARATADSSAVLQHTLLSLAEAIRESGATVTHEGLPEITMSEAHLQQVFQNLISNALKYRRDDPPQIHISAVREEGAWRFSVQDNGIGIDPQYKEKIFGVFKRLHRDRRYSGTGIGLAICHRVVERYGGRIWVESAPGEGSTFCFTVPETGERSRSTAAESSAG
jgi:signal transduction histidine kinase